MSKVNYEEPIVEETMTEEEKQAEVSINEGELLKLLNTDDHVNETKVIEVKRGKFTFRFRVRALSEREMDMCREKNTKYSKNRRLGGMRMPEKTDTVGYHTLVIYTATVKEDREKLWDNKTLWAAANALTGTDLVDKLIPLAGKKQAIFEQIEKLSGFDDDDEEEYEDTVKN